MSDYSDTKNRMSDPVRDRISQQAFDWILINESGEADTVQRRSFSQWLKNSPLHLEEYLMLLATWRELDNLDEHHSVDVDELVSNTQANVVSFDNSQNKQPSSSSKTSIIKQRYLPWVAGILLLVSLMPWLAGPNGQQMELITARGEQVSRTMPDGSIFHLNTLSQMNVHYSAEMRQVEITKGEALFSVEKDQLRPFKVTTPHSEILVLGTEFNVYSHGDQTVVSVVNGKVSVKGVSDPVPANSTTPNSTVLMAGQQVAISNLGKISFSTVDDINRIVSWRQMKLQFREDKLADVAEQFNRYNSKQIRIIGEKAAEKTLTGVFNANSVNTFIAFLEADPSIRVSEQGNALLVFDK